MDLPVTDTCSRCPISVALPSHPTYDLDRVIQQALEEDAGDLGDITSLATIPEDMQGDARFLVKAEGIIAGICVADRVFELVDASLTVKWLARDGDHVQKGDIIGEVRGQVQSILVAERVCLNFLQRMSGIASMTAAMQAVIDLTGSGTKLLDTRKTLPGWRLIDKWAVLIGNGTNHRMGLYDMMMIKDNHIAASGGISLAVQKAHAYLQEKGLSHVFIEVEVGSLDDVRGIKDILGKLGSTCRVKRVMLDNMTEWVNDHLDTTRLTQAIDLLRDMDVELEASGNVTMETVKAIASTGVTFISCGALTHSTKAMDISLKIQTKRETNN